MYMLICKFIYIAIVIEQDMSLVHHFPFYLSLYPGEITNVIAAIIYFLICISFVS